MVAREVLPVADAEIGFVLDVDVELDAVGLNGAFLARRGVHGEQVGLDVAGGAVLPRKVQLEAGYALVVRADLRVSLRVTVRVVLGMCHGRTKGEGLPQEPRLLMPGASAPWRAMKQLS